MGTAATLFRRGSRGLETTAEIEIGEDADYDNIIARYRSENPGLGGSKNTDWSKNMRIVPVNFNTEHRAMLGHCKMILESEGGRIAINPDRFDKLITSVRTAVDNDGTCFYSHRSIESIGFYTVLIVTKSFLKLFKPLKVNLEHGYM
jgi:hypothetical protein